MIEVEIKLKINDEICPRSKILKVLIQKGFSHLHTVCEEDYPEELVDLVERNTETADFVYQYPRLVKEGKNSIKSMERRLS